MESPGTVEPPDFTGVVNQQFFIEPQGGPKHPINYLESFPDALYDKSLDSNLVALMYALLGPSGIGSLRHNYLLARLAIEDAGLHTTDLDALYANPLSFARLANEVYEDDTEGLLTEAQWEKVRTADASYRNRAIDFLKAARAGGTLQGLTLAAKSGLNHPVEIVENYRALYDKYSDDPLGLPYLGQTTSTEEVIVLPRQDRPQSSSQTISVEPVISGGFALAVPMGSGLEEGEVNNTVTIELAFDVTAQTVEEALIALPVVGKGNVRVSGGPLSERPFEVTFTGELADREIPTILVVKNTLVNHEGMPTTINIEVDQAGISADGEQSAISSENWYYAQVAIDKIKPVTAIVTPGKAPGMTKRQPANVIFSDSEFVKVLRYVTGKRGVTWPPRNTTHWIEGGVEHEAPLPQFAQKDHYLNFHNIASVTAYTGDALIAGGYEASLVEPRYFDEHRGPFSSYQKALFPILDTPLVEFPARYCIGIPETPTVQAVTKHRNINLVHGIYPSDYNSLPGTEDSLARIRTFFWASKELPVGSDYLEVDLGTVQAVNFISFRASKKPYDVSISYDLLDQAPARKFVPIVLANPQAESSTLFIGYDAGSPNPWTNTSVNFTNALGGMIYTRFIRIEFARRTGPGSPFTITNNQLLPYSIEVQNLRIGRNIA